MVRCLKDRPAGVARLLWTAVAAFSLLPLLFAEDPHPFRVQDLVMMRRLSDPQVSPDGTTVVFVLRETDLDANRGRTDLWMVRTDGEGMRRLTTDPASDRSPRWAPDGRSIFFLSTRSGSSQVWRLPLDGGEARPVTRLPLDVGNLVVAPSGRRIAFTLRVFPGTGPEATKQRLEGRVKSPATGRVYDHLFVRHWDRWEDGTRSHLFCMDLASGKVTDVMKDMDADTPSTPFGGPEEIAFTPDEGHLVFTARDAGAAEPWSTNFDLFLAPADGSTPPRNLTPENPAWDTSPVFSPDGKTLAFLAMDRPGYESDKFHIVLKPWPEGKPRALAAEWDRSPRSLVFSPDGKTLYAPAANLGQVSLFAVDVASGAVREVVHEGHVTYAAPARDRILFAMDSLSSPSDLYTVPPTGGTPDRITRVNAERLAAIRFGGYEQFTFEGWNGETVYGYMLKPVGFDPSRTWPVAFLIHGGPQGSFGNFFHYRWNAQIYAGAGYAVVMVDFHGSTGYGQAFTDSIRGDWGGKPLEDLKKGLRAALERYPWMDGDRVAALGASFGGYMINWIAGHWPDRFRCLVNHDGNLDERFAYFATDEQWFPEWDHRGTPWTHPEGYEAQNPVNFVDRWKTPMLVIHGGRDFRVVPDQGIATFTALQRRGVPSRFLYFPDESHWVLKPANSILWHETVLGWLDRWVRQPVR